ncbi:MAG: hypothetical protein N4A49_15510 [Marinifilaceae bacterium]|jgi:hypothetical protein|nr:hypothetical protein [Marinifilaceae bacterium]
MLNSYDILIIAFMDKDLIYALGQNPQLIPGIYNYCDGWCDKCPFTKRCLNYSIMEEGLSKEGDSENEGQDPGELDKLFEISMELMSKSIKDLGFEPPNEDSEFDLESEGEKDEQALNTEIMKLSESYSELLDEWFEGFFQEFSIIEKNKDSKEFVSDFQQLISDSIESIRWYQFGIPSKLFRATRNILNYELENNDFYIHDANASAKVALLSIDKSIQSWTFLMSHFPYTEDGVLKILVKLSEIKRMTEREFPNAQQFIRPGFND